MNENIFILKGIYLLDWLAQQWLSLDRNAKKLIVVQSMKLDVSAGHQCTVEYRSRFSHQWRSTSATRQMNLPARLMASRQKAKTSTSAFFYVACHQLCPDGSSQLKWSDQEDPYRCALLLGFSWLQTWQPRSAIIVVSVWSDCRLF